MRMTAVCLLLLLLRMQAAEPAPSEAWLAHAKIAPPMQVPSALDAWQKQRVEIRAKLNELLGDLPPRPPVSAFQVIATEDKGAYRQETIQFDNGAGEIVKGYVFVPKSATPQTKAPAILYCHWHGGQYDIGKQEMLQTNATPVAAGPALAEAGYVVLGIDATCFGERNGHGPDGPQQKGSAGEMTAAKFNLWAGRTLWGMILRDDLTALDYLCSRPEVDAKRIGVTGISMGSTRSWWIMALDDRPRAAVCVACMTRYEELIRAGMLKAHGIYYFVPGMLKHFDTEAVIALAAPRPMLFMTGDQDGGSPVDGVKHLGEIVSKVFALHGEDAKARFENTIYPGVGHVYLPEMWEKTLKWMDRWVKRP
ncbi:alpha/beta hydrolase family protein [Prosthecobacter sp.]|uniref:alpha/beta hydrolase family protein n=1 Tax=Prosthecobacter sp. TaxID=1965333 RepID=UPI001D255A44|nr:alpha/beta hydrolase family protein [Prosthecobacter sp.]MCB1275528.1 acetylxylan esterase [Prosthecobacter sp.]